MLTPSQRDTLLSQLRSRYDGDKVDYWGYPGECVSYVRRWLDVILNGRLDGPMVSPPAPGGVNAYGAYYWSQPTDAIRNLFDVLNYDPNATYPAGSLFVNTGSGHVGIMLDNQPGNPNALVSEQNADPDGSPVGDKQRSKARINGILVLRLAPDAPLWTTTAISPRQVRVKVGSRKWNLGYSDFPSVEANPITTASDNEVFTAVAILHHREIPQYNYYVEDANTPHGWNVLDCMDYTPPPPPYVPPAAPVVAPLAEKYTLVTTVMCFDTASNAKQRNNALSTIDKGEYYVVGRDEQAVKLSKDNKTDIGWVNTFDNKVETPKPITVIPTGGSAPAALVSASVPTLPVDPPPSHDEVVDVSDNSVPVAEVVPAVQPVYEWLRSDKQPVLFHTLNVTEQRFRDLEHPDDGMAILPPNKTLPFSMKTRVKGLTYYIPTAAVTAGRRNGIPETMLRQAKQNPLDLNRDGQTNIQDFKTIWDFIETPLNRGYTLIKDVIPVVKSVQTSERFTQLKKGVVDGITKRKVQK